MNALAAALAVLLSVATLAACASSAPTAPARTAPAQTGPERNVLLLTERSERKPTLRNIKWALGAFLARSAGTDDMVLIYFAGQGGVEIDPRGLEHDGLSRYLIPQDADPQDLHSTALPMDDFQIFSRVQAGRVVAFLDASYSGAAGGRTFPSRRTPGRGVDEPRPSWLAGSRGRAIVSSSRLHEISIGLPELGHGGRQHPVIRGELEGALPLIRLPSP
jgi:uncharacterized caspase-like protein